MRVRYRRRWRVPGLPWGWLFAVVRLVLSARALLWLVLAVWVVWAFGEPQLRAGYSYRGPGPAGMDWFGTERSYIRCDYIGPLGWERVRPLYGRCPLVRFKPL